MPARPGILNVDDNEVARYVKRRILVQAGFEVTDAANAGEALALLDTAEFDAALVDMKLPDMSGFELTRRIRAHPRLGSMPLIQISAVCVTSDDQRDGLDSGADAYLVVPFEPEALVAMVRGIVAGDPARAMRGADGLSRSRIRRVDAYIHAHMDQPITLENLAGAIELSPFYFTRMFKAATGFTPLDYVMETRVEEAVRLLQGTALPLAEIGRRVGFRTQAHFSTVFRKRRGEAPRSVRARAAAAS